MKKINSLLDKIDKVVGAFDGVLLIFILIIVFLQVIFRYVLHASMHGVEELPGFMLIAMIWLAGISVARHDDYIKIDLVGGALPKVPKELLNAFNCGLTAACSAFYAYLDVSFIQSAIKRKTVSTGLKFPVWWVYSITLVAAILTALLFTYHTIEAFRRLAERSDEE